MENTNKMKNLTNDLKAFEQMMKEQRKENSYPEFEFEIDTEEDSPADILLQASGMLLDCSVMVAKAAFLVGLMEAEADVTIQKVEKLQGESYVGLSVRPEGQNAAVTMNLHELHDQVVDNPKRLAAVMNVILTATERLMGSSCHPSLLAGCS